MKKIKHFYSEINNLKIYLSEFYINILILYYVYIFGKTYSRVLLEFNIISYAGKYVCRHAPRDTWDGV